jgi:glycerol-3-phosphate acyltransferase PlsY
MIIARYAAVVLIGYLLGSIPFGLLISRRTTGADLREVGSGKIGMTNVLRTSGKKAAALALVLDIAKGAVVVLIAGLIFGNSYHYIAQVVAALSAIGGHSWSVFLKFKGGRGVATFIGGLVALYWPAAIVGGGIMLIIGFRTKYMSLGSITGAVVAFVMLLVLNVLGVLNVIRLDLLKTPPIEYVIYAMICTIFIYVMHRDNIIRLVSGTERRLDQRVEANNLPSSGNHR